MSESSQIVVAGRGITMPSELLIKELQKALGEAHSARVFSEAQVTGCLEAYERLQIENTTERQSFANTIGTLQNDIAALKQQLVDAGIEPVAGVSGVSVITEAQISEATAEAMAADEIAMDEAANPSDGNEERPAMALVPNPVSPIRVVPAGERVPRPTRRSTNAKKKH